MMRTSKGKIAGRWAACGTILAVAAWSLIALVEGRQNASAQQLAHEQYESQLNYHYGHNGHLPAGNIEDLFARIR
jgi:hypothetical protein